MHPPDISFLFDQDRTLYVRFRICGMRTEWKDSLMHMLHCSRLMYSSWIQTKYKKEQRSALKIEFALILFKFSPKSMESSIRQKLVLQVGPESHPLARPAPC